MSKSTDIRILGSQLFFLPVRTRVPLKFGTETLTSVTCARAAVWVENRSGQRAVGWGETPLSVQWVWPCDLPYEARHQALRELCCELARDWAAFAESGHALELGHSFQQRVLSDRLAATNADRPAEQAVPFLAALVCCSPFDLALHDAFGKACGLSVYDTYSGDFLSADLSCFLSERNGRLPSFQRRFPGDYLAESPPPRLSAWHLVGGLDALCAEDLRGDEPQDGYPVVLGDWIKRDGLKCLKIKLRGNDAQWDFQRIVRVGQLGMERGVEWLSADFNCTVTDPAYVNKILDRLMAQHPRIYGMVLYVEQPFPYELTEHPIDVHSTSARKPLFMDESAHDWHMVALGRELGWTGVALKTCKTQTGALLALSWAKHHGMTLMVQDLTNPMLAQIPHVLLAAHAETIMGVETNAMQFYPQASDAEALVHPGLYRRAGGVVDLSSIRGAGFGYRLDEMTRQLPAAAVDAIG